MEGPNVSRQTTSVAPARADFHRGGVEPVTVGPVSFKGPAQWALEGAGAIVLRPLLDFVTLAVGVIVAVGGPSAVLSIDSPRAPLLALPLLAVLLFQARGLYRSRLRTLAFDRIISVVSGVSVAAMTVAMIGFFANGRIPPQSAWVRAWLYALLAVCAGRLLLSQAQRWARVRHVVGKPVLIVGAGLVGVHVARRLRTHPEYGLVPVGFLDEEPRSITEVGGRELPVLGTIEDLEKTIGRTGARNLIVAFSSAADSRVSRLIQRCAELGVEVSVVPRMFDTINNRVGYDTVGGLPLLSFTTVNPTGAQFAVKHALDRILALLILIVLTPLLVLVTLLTWLTSPGPVLFRQRRVGRDGRLFDLYKFRSMRESSVQLEASVSALEQLLAEGTAPGGVEGEDRRTPLGRLLRRASIDELPQLLNVLRGEMSLVGPRPERPEFVELFRQDIDRYGDRHRVKSGITGWAQVHGLRGQTSLADRVEWDNYYIAHWSLRLDFEILAMTFLALFHDAE
jgi:exopolysaccharide biosynthesis polyprenyl glycosylphosphotransferase